MSHAGNDRDGDAAIERWRAELAENAADQWAAVRCGNLLLERAHRDGRLADATEAVRLLESGISAGTDDPVVGERWYSLGLAHQVCWVLGKIPGSLDAALECLDEALRRVADDDGLLKVQVVRAQVGVAAWESDQRQSSRRARELLDEARAALAATPAATPEVRAEVAGRLACLELLLSPWEPGAMDLERIGDLAALGATGPDDSDGRFMATAAQVLVDHWASTDRAGEGPRATLDALGQLAGLPGLSGNKQGLFELLGAEIAGDHAHYHGDLVGLDRAVAVVGGWPGADPDVKALTALITAVRAGQRGDLAALETGLRQARSLVAGLPPSVFNELTGGMVRLLDQGLKVLAGQEAELRSAFPASGTTGTVHSALQAFELWMAMHAASRSSDLPALRRIAETSGPLFESLPPEFLPVQIIAATTAGLAESAVARLDPADRAAYHRSMRWLAEAMRLAGPEHKNWAIPAQQYAAGLRVADQPDLAGSRRLGRSVLRARARQVLLQSGTDYALEAARSAVADARAVVAWCLDDAPADPAALEDLLEVLDAGRGMTLHAATVSRTVADLLIAAGQADLAAQWQATAGLGRTFASAGSSAVNDDLRLRVLRALQTDEATGSPLLEPVTVEEVRDALSAVGSDALVYLIPAGDDGPGAAFIVPVAGPASILRLPGLRDNPDWTMSDLAVRLGSRDVVPAGGSAPEPGSGLDEVCRWAWSAGMAGLITHVEQWQLGRPARLVLIPAGTLGLVPWHAAHDGHRYAVQELVLSYGVTARMLCASARNPLREPRSALVVGDPGGDLPFAGAEARAVHRAFYPAGTYLGHPAPDGGTVVAGRGTAEDVLAWISTGDRGPSSLHLACHGRADPARPADAHLVLADGNLPAGRLLEASRLAQVELDRVFLAACSTNATGSDYDEAFTLATSFLAAGAHTVFGSLWTVPDASTSLLMFMVHHFLNAEGASPVDALHRAQLWMLDPDRRAPASMPAELVAHCTRADIAELGNWAAFTHLGR